MLQNYPGWFRMIHEFFKVMILNIIGMFRMVQEVKVVSRLFRMGQDS
jgi:hypothetical protein